MDEGDEDSAGEMPRKGDEARVRRLGERVGDADVTREFMARVTADGIRGRCTPMPVDRRKLTALGAAAAAAPLLGAAGPARTIALLFDSLTSPFWVAAAAQLRREAARRGWRVVEAVSNMDDNRQHQQVRAIIQRGVDGIVMVHTDDKAVIPSIRAANAARVPLVHFNRPPADNDGYSVAVVADNRQLMRSTVEALIAKARAQGGTYKAAILIGDLADANGVNRRRGFEDAVANNRDVVEVVAQIATEWNADKAFAGLSNALQAHPDINMLVTSSDFMTPQIEQALRAAGKWHPAGHPKHVLIAGFDGDTGGCRQLRAGFYDVDGVQDLQYEVRLSFQALDEMWAGRRPPKILLDPGFVAHRETIVRDASRVWGCAPPSPSPANPSAGNAATFSASTKSGLTFGALMAAVAAFAAILLTPDTFGDALLILYPLLILVIGQLCVMLVGQIDLSVGATLALASIGSASVMTQSAARLGDGGATAAGVVTALVVGLAVGLINGLGTAWLRMPSFVVTLAMMMMGGGAAVWYASSVSDTISIGGLPAPFIAIGYGDLLGIPLSMLLAVAVTGVVAFMLGRTLLGRWIYAVGHNAAAARASGVPVRLVTLTTFVVSGLCASLASIVYSARLETGQPSLGSTMLLDVVGAAVIGGVSLFGGRGTVLMALAGAAFLAVLDKSLQLLGLSLFLVLAIKGAAILLAASADVARKVRVRAS